MHTNSKLLFQRYAQEFFHPHLSVLEIGPDRFPSTYQSLITPQTQQWHTLDLYQHDQLTYQAPTENQFPIPDETYDIVLSGQVIEHVRKPWIWLREVTRVCKVGGLVITVNPVSWPYHEAPIDCWRIYPEGMKALYEEAALEVILSLWDSLELPKVRHRLPGRSPEWQPRWLRQTYRALGCVGFPRECSYDAITIGRKSRSLDS